MKGRYGIAMNIYGKILPGTRRINRIVALSREAKQRLNWMDWYNSHNQNARLTCRHFGIPPDTFYRWKNRYNPADLSTLEDDRTTRTPRNLRKPQTAPALVFRTKELRETYPRWGKKKLWKLLKKEGWDTSISTVGRMIERLRARGILVEPAIVTARLAGQKRKRKNKRPCAIPEIGVIPSNTPVISSKLTQFTSTQHGGKQDINLLPVTIWPSILLDVPLQLFPPKRPKEFLT